MEEFDRGEKIIRSGADNRLFEYLSFSIYITEFCFLEYASREWLSHALAASPALTTDYQFKKECLDKMPTLRDI